MSRSQRKEIYDKIRQLAQKDQRYLDMAIQLQVYRRDENGTARPAELLGRVYGGRWDAWGHRYIDQPGTIHKIGCHPGQIELLTFSDDSVSRVLVLGAPGGGKTDCVVIRALINALERPGGVHGLIAPTSKRLTILWGKMLRILQPYGWLRETRMMDGTITIANGSKFQFLSAKKQSGDLGSPIAGYDLHSAVEDEQQNLTDEDLREIDARGRVNKNYQVFSTATNERVTEFQKRLNLYKSHPRYRLLRMRGDDNVFTPAEHWEKLKELWPKDEYERKVLGLDISAPDAVYPAFGTDYTIAPEPKIAEDITKELIADRFPAFAGKDVIIGADLGTRTSASVVLRAYRNPGQNDRLWWAVGEITTTAKTADYHAEEIKKWCVENRIDPNRVLLVGDPHSAQTDGKSDYALIRKAGLNLVKAAGTKIRKKHRFNMMNALLRDANGKSRFYIDCDDFRRPACGKLVDSLYGLRYGPDGNPETFGKGTRDLTHWADAASYAVFPWEKVRGQMKVEFAGTYERAAYGG